MRWIRAALKLGVLLVVFTLPLAAQNAPAPPGGVRYRGVLASAHLGLDQRFQGFVIGGGMHFLPDPWGIFELSPNAQVEFREGIRDWQANADLSALVYQSLFVGGGGSYRNTIFDEDEGRDTRAGFSVFAGLRGRPSPGRMGTRIEVRWSFISTHKPRILTLGFSYPLLLLR